jgi:hypothetical protein
MNTTPRYEIIERKRAIHGLKFVIVDNEHPSGVKGLTVRNFKTLNDAKEFLGNRSCIITKQA